MRFADLARNNTEAVKEGKAHLIALVAHGK